MSFAKWRKGDYHYIDTIAVQEYPWMHYRFRKGFVFRTTEQYIKDRLLKHIYPNIKEISRWESFQIHSKQLLRNLKVSLVLEIKHYSKPKSLIFKMRRGVQKLVESVILLGSVLDVYLQENQKEDKRNFNQIKDISIVAELISTTLLDRLDHLHILHLERVYQSKLPAICIDCGNDFNNRWRDPQDSNKHLICSILGY